MPQSRSVASSNARLNPDGTPRAIGKPRGRRRDRDCQTCKLRNVKCDLNRPSCDECTAAGVPCRGYTARVVWVGSATDQSHEASGNISASPPIGPTATTALSQSSPNATLSSPDSILKSPSQNDDHQVDWAGTDRNSFIGPLVALCQSIIHLGGDALGPGQNQYISPEVIRLISKLRDFAQARIDTHPSQAGESAAKEIWESDDAARYRVDALVGLKETLAVANPFALIGIAAFAFFDVCDSGFGQWQRHLVGAKSLLDYHCTCRQDLDRLTRDVTGLTAMVSRLIWFDVMGAIVRGSSDMIFEPWHREVLDDEFFRIVGCPSDTFHLFARIAAHDPSTDASELYLCAMDELLKLNQGGNDWDRAADAYRCAAVIAILCQVRDRQSLTSPSPSENLISSAVDRTCRILVSLSSSSQYYIHLAVTAYLAGINATTLAQCDVVRNYWQNCTHAGVRRYPDGLERCEARWRETGLVS
ncbi:hypothetical protein CC79DRAFT_807752 [Sarocladium strictum]